MSFAIRASTNSLATPDNLARWGKVVDSLCKLCVNTDQPNSKTTATLGHILNSCPKMLDRYEWRHNGVLAYLYGLMMDSKPPGITIFADIEGAKVNGGTVPPDIMVTPQRPDMVIINKNTTPSTVFLPLYKKHCSCKCKEKSKIRVPVIRYPGSWISLL